MQDQYNEQNVKLQYESPTLTVHGSFESLTQQSSSGGSLDQDFPAGTPFGALTFS